MARLISYSIVFIIICVIAVTTGKIFEECKKEENKQKITMKVSSLKKCVLHVTGMDKKSGGGGGGGDDAGGTMLQRVLKHIRNPSVIRLIKMTVEKICSVRKGIYGCLDKTITSIECFSDIDKIFVNAFYNIFLKPTFNYTCVEIFSNGTVPKLIDCAMNVKDEVMQCIPMDKISKRGSLKLEDVCRLIYSVSGCLLPKLKKSCDAPVPRKISGLFNLFEHQLDCPVLLSREKDRLNATHTTKTMNATHASKTMNATHAMKTMRKRSHVNKNNWPKSSAVTSLYSCSLITIVITLITLRLSRWNEMFSL